MVMGPTHAVSGAAGWLLLAPTVTTATGTTLTELELVVSTAVVAGSALIPDIDAPGSTVSRAFGWLSLAVSHAVNKVAAFVYGLTRGKGDGQRESGHRTLTHTLVFAVGLSLAVGAACARWEKAAVVTVLFVTVGLAVRGLMAEWAAERGWLVTTVASGFAAYGAYQALPAESYWWVGIAVGFGVVTHLVGDMITRQACPLLWPLPLGGETWQEIGLPSFLRIRAGGKVEKAVLLPALTLVVVIIGSGVWTPGPIEIFVAR